MGPVPAFRLASATGAEYTGVGSHSASSETFGAGRSWGETLKFATRATACADQRRASAPSRARTSIRRAAGLLRRLRCGPVRAADARPASEPLSAPAGRPTEHSVCTPMTTSPAPCTGRLRYRDSYQPPGRFPCARYDRVLTRSRAALGFRGASATQGRRQSAMNPPGQSTVLVDGNNVIGSRPEGWWRDRAKAARRIVAEITPLALGRGGAWTVTFDGQAPPGMASSPECLTALHTGHGRSDGADDRIVEPVRTPRDRATSLVYTSDTALRGRVHALRAQVAGAL